MPKAGSSPVRKSLKIWSIIAVMVMVVVVVPGWAAQPASALAPTTVAVSDAEPLTLNAVAGPGQVNDLSFTLWSDPETGADFIDVDDDVAGVVSSTPLCMQVSRTKVRCAGDEVAAFRVRSGDGADRVRGFEGTDVDLSTMGQIVIDAGSGNDQIDGPVYPAKWEYLVLAGSGDDRVKTIFQPSAGITTVGQVLVRLGAGNDVADVAAPVVDLDLDGSPDFLVLVAGGDDADHIMASGAVMARGDDGDDVLEGGEGPQRLFGERGNDMLSGGADMDFCHPGAGTDTVAADCEKTAGPDDTR